MAKTRKIPQRMCVGCREMKNKKELTRVVRTPQGSIEIDNSGKKPGRGAYLCPQLDCLQQALKGKRLQKALEQEIPAEVVEMLTNQISKSFP
ncbi:RNase P modulator RnpM [Syntrophomonas curvata]